MKGGLISEVGVTNAENVPHSTPAACTLSVCDWLSRGDQRHVTRTRLIMSEMLHCAHLFAQFVLQTKSSHGQLAWTLARPDRPHHQAVGEVSPV